MQNNNQPQSQQTDSSKVIRKFERFLGMYDIKERYNMNEQPSPTEQPGDAKHTPLPQGKYYYGEADENNVKPVFGAHDQLLWFSAPGSTTRFSDEKEAGRAAKIPALLSEVSTLRSKQDELVAELEQLRSELGKMREALEFFLEMFKVSNDKYTEWVGTKEIYDAVIKVESALSGGSKQ